MLDFLHTRRTLKDLENDLRCSVCGNIAGSPCTLGGCEHIYCSACCEELLGQSCVICHIPGHVKDAQVNRQLFNLVNLCKRLDQILATPDSNDSENGQFSDKMGTSINHAEGVNEGGVNEGGVDGGVYDFVSPELSTPTKLPLKRKSLDKKENMRQRFMTSVEKGRKSSPRAKVVDVSNRTGSRVHRTTDRGMRGQSTSSEVREMKSAEPGDQTTMTQFFDYMETNDGIVLDDSSSSTANVGSEKRNATKKMSEKSTSGKATGESKGKTGGGSKGKTSGGSRGKRGISKGASILRVRKAADNAMDSDRSEEEDLSVLHSSKGKESKVREVSGTHRISNRGERDSLMKEKWSDTDLPSESKKGRRSTTPTDTTTDSKKGSGTMATGSTTAESKKDRRSTMPATNTNTRKTARRSLPGRLDPETSTIKTPTHKTFTRTRSGPLKNESHSSVTSTRKGSQLTIDKKNAKGETPLQVACIKGDLERVETLLSSGANPNTRDNAGWTPLHESCHYGHADIAERLLGAGALVDVPGTDNETPLHDAVRHMKMECVRLLVRHGASVNARNIKGLTPVDFASGNTEMKSALTTEGASVVTPSIVQVDPLHYQSPCFLGTGLSRDQRITLQKCASKLQATVVEDFSLEVTHVVTTCNKNGLCPRTIKYLQGVLTGRWIVNMDWVEMCLEYGMKVCEEAFEIPGTSSDPESRAAEKGRVNRQQQLPGLFDGCQFYFSGNFEYPTPEKEELVKLVKLGGGVVIHREPRPGHIPETDITTPYHASVGMETCCIFVVHDNKCKFQPIRTSVVSSVTASWVMDCISQFRLMNL